MAFLLCVAHYLMRLAVKGELMGIEGKKIRSTNVYFAHKLLFGIAKKVAMQTNEEPE